MPHATPFVLPAGRSVQGLSLGFRAYSLRVDNLSNQWLQEESTLTWIPPYSLGTIIRLWGTSVALLLDLAPVGQAQLAPIAGEYAVAVYSDEQRIENPGVPVRQFTLVQAVSDLTMGPQPALPPVSVDRLYADSSGNIHHLHSDGADRQLVDPSNASLLLLPVLILGGDLSGQINNAQLVTGAVGTAELATNAVTQRALAVGLNANPTTTSVSYVDMDGNGSGNQLRVDLNTNGGDLLVWLSARTSNSLGTAVNFIAVSLDGAAEVAQRATNFGGAGFSAEVSTIWLFTGVSAASHNVRAKWSVNSGTGTLGGTDRGLLVMEVKR